MNPFSAIPFSSFIINIILAAVVFGLSPSRKTNRAYTLFACNFALWAFLNFLEWNTSTPGILRLFARLEPLCWLPTTFLVLNFIYVLVKRPHDRVFRFFRAIVFILSVTAFLTGCLVSGFRQMYWGEYVIVTKLYLPAVLMTSLFPAFWGFYILFKTVKSARDPHFRTHLQYLTIGTLAMFALVLSESFATSLLTIDSIPFLGTFFLIIQSGFIFLAIVRHRFLSVDLRDAAHDIFSYVNEGVVLLDLNQGISTMNASAHKFFGIAANTPLGDLEQLFGTQYRFDENIENLEITASASGENKIGLLSQSNLYDRGVLLGKLVVVHDMTQKREDERKRAMLENQVKQSHVSRLEALGKLAGGIAHDFNNVLSGIIGYATLLRLENVGKNEEHLSYTENIIQTAQQATGLTKKMLTFARRDVSELTVFNLHDVIADTLMLLRHTIDKRITIQNDLSAVNFMLMGDRVQIQNMLLNMAINACDAMPENGELRLKTKNAVLSEGDAKAFNKEACGGDYILIDIEDTGTGMTEEVKKMIFDPFFTTKQPGKGTGLGLASAYGTMGSHKGFISVDSQIGKGTVFHVFFPLQGNNAIMESETAPVVEAGTGMIVLVDDEENVRVPTAKMLTALGYTVFPYSHGEEAVQYYAQCNGKSDLVILDVMMPGISGVQCAQKMQRINPKTKFLFISGFADTVLTKKLNDFSTAIGPITTLRKPFTLEQLSQQVKAALG